MCCPTGRGEPDKFLNWALLAYKNDDGELELESQIKHPINIERYSSSTRTEMRFTVLIALASAALIMGAPVSQPATFARLCW